jgi:transposase
LGGAPVCEPPVDYQTVDAHTGFHLLPQRWMVDRTFAWLGRYRCLSKDYERSIKSSEGMVYLASIRHLLNGLAAANFSALQPVPKKFWLREKLA